MNENFLSFVWKYRLYDKDLVTTSGIPVTVIKTGEQQSNSGPDFFNARVRIGDTLWAGNVEIHVKASDWYRHHHHHDKAYDNVILHVVYEADNDIIAPDLTTIPTIALSEQTDENILRKYSKIRASGLTIPCGNHLREVEELVLNSWIDRMVIQRLERKTSLVEQALITGKYDWEDAFYQVLARNFGFHVNSGPFEMLARTLPHSILTRHSDQPHQVEALLFGQAGFLEEDYRDEYPRLLRTEYRFLAKKYGLIPLDRHIWKLLRMRPANFPTIRLSQFGTLITSGEVSLQKALTWEDAQTAIQKLQAGTSPYWQNHFLFDKTTRFSDRLLGVSSARNLIINSIIPSVFHYGTSNGEEMIRERALRLLMSMPPETNHILSAWRNLNVAIPNAYTGQALLGLYHDFCSQKKCLNCGLGTAILRKHDFNS